jgi:hypothetical protein
VNRVRGQNKNGNASQSAVELSRERASAGTAAVAACPELGAITARLRREDVSEPERVATLVRSAMEELVRELPLKLHTCDRRNIIDWMANDPYLRGRVLEYFEKVLT